MQLRTKVRLSVYVALVLTQVKKKKELFWFCIFKNILLLIISDGLLFKYDMKLMVVFYDKYMNNQ